MESRLHTLSAIELRDSVVRGQVSCLEVARYFLERIDRFDPVVGAFLAVFHDRVLERARLIDRKRTAGQSLGKLAGVPVAIKDNIHVQGELTTCASKLLANYRAPFSATVIRLLEQEDALILGKANLDEFAMGSSTEYSALQLTKNPWDLECSPGGSSGGSAAAVAARLCLAALGTDTGGSIRQPAALCGVVGFKPSYGRVSRYGLVPLAPSMDQIGPLAVNSRDAALIMEVIESGSYVEGMVGGVRGMRIGVPWKLIDPLADQSKHLFRKAIEALERAECRIVDIDIDFFEDAVAVYTIIGNVEAAESLAGLGGIDRFGEGGFGTQVKRRLLLGEHTLSSSEQHDSYTKARQLRASIVSQLQSVFESCDLIATPVTRGPAFRTGSIQGSGEMSLEDIYTIPANLAGLPAIAIPSGFIEDKPIGVQFVGPYGEDNRVFRAAYAFERALGMRAGALIPGIFS